MSELKIAEEDKYNLEQAVIDLVRLALKTGLIEAEVLHNIAYEF